MANLWRRSQRQSVLVPITAVLLALLIGAGILALSGANPLDAYAALYRGSFGNTIALERTLEKATPLIFSGLAVAFAFKAGLFNIGAQGQLLLGALAAAVAGFAINGLPFIIHTPLALLIGGLAGALFGAIPGMLKTYTGAHEVITTIMLNFVAINLTDYWADGPLKDETPGNIIARTPQILETAEIPAIGPIPLGFLIAVLVAFTIWWLLQGTTLGYEIRTVGLNAHAAHYAGMRVSVTIILTMFLSGLLAALGGAVETLGVVGRFQPGFNANLGFDGITIALLAKNHPVGVILAALLVGAMKAGSSQMQFSADVAVEIIDVILALMLFLVTADIIVRTLIRVKDGEDAATVTLSTSWSSD